MAGDTDICQFRREVRKWIVPICCGDFLGYYLPEIGAPLPKRYWPSD